VCFCASHLQTLECICNHRCHVHQPVSVPHYQLQILIVTSVPDETATTATCDSCHCVVIVDRCVILLDTLIVVMPVTCMEHRHAVTITALAALPSHHMVVQRATRCVPTMFIRLLGLGKAHIAVCYLGRVFCVQVPLSESKQ